MRTGPGFDEQSVLALVNQLHDANPAKRTFTLADVAEALYGPGSAAIAQGDLVAPAGQAVSQPVMPVLDGSAQQHPEETRARRPAPGHDDRGGGVSSEPGLTGVWAPFIDESAAAGSRTDEQPSDAPDPPVQPGETSPRSRTDLNGYGCPHRNLRISRSGACAWKGGWPPPNPP